MKLLQNCDPYKCASPGVTNKGEKRLRTVFTVEQRKMLESTFQQNTLPGSLEIITLSQRLNINPKIIRTWFQNRRTLGKKHAHKLKQRPNTHTAGNVHNNNPPSVSISQASHDSLGIENGIRQETPPPNVTLVPPPKLDVEVPIANSLFPMKQNQYATGLWNKLNNRFPSVPYSVSPVNNYWNGFGCSSSNLYQQPISPEISFPNMYSSFHAQYSMNPHILTAPTEALVDRRSYEYANCGSSALSSPLEIQNPSHPPLSYFEDLSSASAKPIVNSNSLWNFNNHLSAYSSNYYNQNSSINPSYSGTNCYPVSF